MLVNKLNHKIERGSHENFSWFKFYAGPLSCSSWNLERLDLSQEQPSEEGENQRQIQPTHGTEQESNLGGRRVLLSLRLPFFPMFDP